MRECSIPAVLTAPTSGNLTDLVFDNAAQAPQRVVFAQRSGEAWRDVTTSEFLAQVTAVAKGLVAGGVEPGDRVALMSRTRYEWTLFDFAIWCAGAVPVPVYETSSAEQVQWIASDSGARFAVVETVDHAATLKEVRDELPGLEQQWVIDDGCVDALIAAGRRVDDDELTTRRGSLTPESLATVIYTSGTTGRPKGCELTHGNFMVDVYNVVEALDDLFKDDKASTLLFLPLAHVFARIIQVGCVRARVRLGHTADVTRLMADLATFKPTFILSVPRVFEKVFNAAAQKAQAERKGKVFDAAAATAIAFSEALDAGGPTLPLRARHLVFDRLVYKKLRAALGGEVAYALSGGAPLGTRLGHFFRGMGITIFEGYGLTENTGAASVNVPSALRIGTVGRPIPGSSVRIADDGEVLLKGGHLFRAYRGNPEATREALGDDGWFCTGDIGELDGDGFLRITGRKKEIIVTAGGKNVAPAVIEDRIRAHALVSQCMVVGDGQPFIAALITIDPDALPSWCTAHGKRADTAVADLVDDEQLRADVQKAVDDGNKAVSKAEAVKKFRILPVDFTLEGGQLTPSLKLKRGIVLKEFATEVDALYS